MIRILNILNLPHDYLKLPFSDTPAEKKTSSQQLIPQFLLLFLLSAFSHFFKVFTEYGFDRLLIAFSVLLPFYYSIKIKYRLPVLIIFFAAFLVYALGAVSAAFYILSALFLLALIRSVKSFWMYLLLFAFFAALIVLRLEIFYAPKLIYAVPYIAAAFMFRGIRMYYESKHGFLKSGFWMDLAFFFIPANLCFLLFGVIDPVKFSNSFVGFPAFKTGIKRISLGMGLALLYRFILNVFPVSFEEVINFSTLFHYAVLKYLIVINLAGVLISGLGTLGLCGFELPPLFGNLLLATSFTEMWRKVNAYWREFMIRIFYYPLFLKLRKLSMFLRIFIAINAAFIISWILHDYQLFWISGEWHPKLTGLMYWLLFGNFVAVNVYQEFFIGKPPLRNFITRAFFAAGVFFTCAFLWLLWNSETISEFTYLIYSSFHSPHFSWADLLYTLLGLFAVYIALVFVADQLKAQQKKMEEILLLILLPLFFLFLTLSSFSFFEKNYPVLKNKIAVFDKIELSEEENFVRDEGYYEQVVAGNKSTDWPWEVHLKGNKKWGNSKGATRRTGDIVLREFVPLSNTNMGYFSFHINSDGLRDKEYSLEKPPDTFRMAMLGGSNECGYGVEKENIFETIVENKLDSIYAPQQKNVEIINFAGLGNMLLQGEEITKKKVLKYKPDVIIYFAHPEEVKHIARNFSKLILNGIDLKYDSLKNIKADARVSQRMSWDELITRLMPYSERIINWGYNEIASDCRKNGIVPLWVYLPTPKDENPHANFKHLSEMATAHGFVIIDLSDAYKGYPFNQMRVSEEDFHPSVLGNKLLAKLLLQRILEKKKELGLN